MILAAGQGTRLRPLTLVRPKVLAPINGSSVLDFWIWRLYHAGFGAVVINAYHLHESLVAAVRNSRWPSRARSGGTGAVGHRRRYQERPRFF